jgi:uncharacterized protein (TIGR02391 family)
MVMMSGGSGVQGPVPPEQVRELPTEGVALLLLEYFVRTGADQIHTKDVMNLARQGYQADAYLCDKVSDALAWIESHGFLGPSGLGDARRLTTRGREMAKDRGMALKKLFADQRLAGKLDPTLEAKVRLPFASGDYEQACFAAMKEVEVAVRAAAQYDDSQYGTAMMQNAFSAKGGPLTDAGAVNSEQIATMQLFAGAIGLFKNPNSHRTVKYADPIEAVETIQLANLLLRIVRRAEARATDGDA